LCKEPCAPLKKTDNYDFMFLERKESRIGSEKKFETQGSERSQRKWKGSAQRETTPEFSLREQMVWRRVTQSGGVWLQKG